MPERRAALDALEAHFPAIVDAMPYEFDSHEFILHLAQQRQAAYARALAAYAGTARPFQVVHAQIARRLSRRVDLVRKAGTIYSQDIFRQTNLTTLWRNVMSLPLTDPGV